jgi:hypothetical protein
LLSPGFLQQRWRDFAAAAATVRQSGQPDSWHYPGFIDYLDFKHEPLLSLGNFLEKYAFQNRKPVTA